MDFKRENLFSNYLERTDAIDFGPFAKDKIAAIKLFKMYAIDTLCERDILLIISPINFKIDL